MDNLPLSEAHEQLNKRLTEGDNLESEKSITHKPVLITATDDDQALLKTVFAHYHETLKNSDTGLVYLEKRGLKDPVLIEYFKLGIADQSLMRCLPSKDTKAGMAVRDQLKILGLIRPTGHEFFKGSIVVPILDNEGNIKQAYGRKLINKSRTNPDVHRYLPRPHETVWHSEAVQGTKEIILCKSLIDAMTFWQSGFKNVLSAYGTNGFTDAHYQLLLQHEIERVIITYDYHDTKNVTSSALVEQLQNQGIACFYIQFPRNMDVNEYALTVPPAHKSLGLVISKAQYLGEGEAPQLTSLNDQMVVLDDFDLLVNREIMTQARSTAKPIKNEMKSAPKDLDKDENKAPEQAEVSSSDSDEQIEISDKEIIIHYQTRRYRVRGLVKNQTYDHLKINLLASEGEHCFVDNLDLYSAKLRSFFIKQTALELGQNESTIKRDVGKLLLTLETLQLKQIEQMVTPDTPEIRLNPQDEKEALALLRSTDLLQLIIDDFNHCGVVGEEINKLTSYLAVTSRQLSKPLAVVIQSSSAAGKSSLMDAVLAFMPEEAIEQFSAMSAQSLFYMGQTNLKHKVLAIAEEEGAHSASYALKLLQSEGEVTMASTGKNPETGQLETQTYKVEGPTMLLMTTTAIDVDEELLNRCLILTVNESREQTEAIHSIQRTAQTLEGMLLNHSKQALIRKHQNAQRLLKPINIINPFANQLTFVSNRTRTRRDHMKYLQLINAVTFLHQHQRGVKTVQNRGEWLEYIEVTVEDIAIANSLAHAILGRSLDELPPQTRCLLELIFKMVQSVCRAEKLSLSVYRFSRRDIRQHLAWSDGQLKIHCKRLEEMEYLLVHKGGRGLSIQYELLYSGQNTNADNQLHGLIDTSQLGAKPKLPASLRETLGQPSH